MMTRVEQARVPGTREDQLHAAVYEWLCVALPLGAVVHHSPNEGKRGWRAQAQLASHGVLAGFPDLIILHEGRAFFIELKAGSGRVSRAQAQAHMLLEGAGFKVAVARSIADVDDALRGWGVPVRTVPLHGRPGFGPVDYVDATRS